MTLKWLAAFACTGLMYCGGGSGGGGGASGVDRNKTIAELSDGEAMDLCEFIGNSIPDERTIDCGDGNTITVGIDPAERDEQIAECTAEVSNLPDCTATVGDAEDCANGQEDFNSLSDDELCDIFTGMTDPPEPPAACNALEDPGCEAPEPV
jgi:hypothetical protein